MDIISKVAIEQKNWQSFIRSQRGLFDDFFYENYLQSCKILDIDRDKIIISVPSEYTKQTLLEKELDKKFAKNNFGVVFVVDQTWGNTVKTNPEVTRSNFTFTDLVVDKFNKGVVDVAWKILSGDNIWTPFFIYSEPGLGKTHILKAIKHEADKMIKKCYYIHANTFGNLLLRTFNEGSMAIENLKESFNNHEIILFDDVQFLAKREKTNEVLFQIFCNVLDQEKQIIFTSDQHPEELNGFEKRLKSRFINGLTLKIDFPDQEAAVKIAEKKALKILGKSINKIHRNVIEFIGKHYRKDVRRIEGTIKKIKFSLIQTSYQEVNLSTFHKMFSDQPTWDKEKISIRTIQKETAKLYGVSHSAMVSGSRKSKAVKARAVAMYLIRHLVGEGFATIATKFGGKNHTTAVNAVKKIEEHLKNSVELQKEINFLKKNCQNQ